MQFFVIMLSKVHKETKFARFLVNFKVLFAHGCDVTSMGFVGSLMALTHSILILSIVFVLNIS